MVGWAVARALCAALLVRGASAPTCGEGTALVPDEDACTASCPGAQVEASGRVYIAGIFDLQDDGGHVEQLKHHFQLTVALLNNHSDGMWDDVLSDVTIEHAVTDSGCSESLGARAYWSVREWGRPLHGVIGCRCSSASRAVQRIAQLERVPQIAMASTAAELSNRQLYPYFYRTVAPEGTAGSLGALMNLFRAFGWTRIGVLSTEMTHDTAQQFITDWTGEHPAQDGRGVWTGEIAYSYTVAMDATGLDMESMRQAFAEIPVDDPAVNSKIILLLCDTGESCHVVTLFVHCFMFLSTKFPQSTPGRFFNMLLRLGSRRIPYLWALAPGLEIRCHRVLYPISTCPMYRVLSASRTSRTRTRLYISHTFNG